jgi:16S rRNA (guanine527-N7)-methyltransferase
MLAACCTAAQLRGRETQAEYGNLAFTGDRRDPVPRDRQARENRKVAVPGTPRRGERFAGAKTEHAGHEAGSGPQPLPRPSPNRSPLPRDPVALAPSSGIWPIVDDGLAALEVELSTGMRAALESQLRLMLAWNEHVNLTALRTAEQVARGHVLDSLSAVPLVRRLFAQQRRPASGGARLLDLGSGAGYPGLPLAVALPAGECALVDSVGKKAAFLEVAASAAGTALREHAEAAPAFAALGKRAEQLAADPAQRGAWDIVTARAVGPLAEVVELGLPLLRVGGHVVAWKREPHSEGLREEINACRRLLQAAGGEHPFVAAPDREGRAGLADHRLVVVRKLRPTPERFPRSPAERRRSALR